MAYNAVVVQIKVAPHPNADRLQLGYVNGARVIVGMDTKDGDVGVFFEPDGQLSKEYCEANDLVARKDENGVKVGGGYFNDKRRVVAQAFRQVKSEGFYMPLSSLSFTGYDLTKLKVGDTFDTLGKIPICNKYFTAATLAAMGKNGTKKLKQYADFPEHKDTAQFRFIPVPKNALIHISEKEHGTSVRYGHVKVHRPRTGFMGWLSKHIPDIVSPYITTHEYVLGTRRAILNQKDGKYQGGYYGDGEPYILAAQNLHGKLKQDEIVYGELVGYTSNGSALFTQGTNGLKDVQKTYGGTMVFSYGCVEGTAKFKVYRITQGLRDLTWYEIQARCEELGVETVTNYESLVFNGDRDALNAKIEGMLEGPSTLDARHIREGVCLRIESPEGIRICKSKSWTFGVLEGYIKDNDAYVDMEEIA